VEKRLRRTTNVHVFVYDIHKIYINADVYVPRKLGQLERNETSQKSVFKNFLCDNELHYAISINHLTPNDL
jgi:hypothetical protein